MSYTDPQLVRASLTGDSRAFTQLYEAYATRIYQYHYYRTFHKETAEDLTSQTFMRALERLRSYDEQKGTFSAWVYRIARNLLIDHVRATRPNVDAEDAWNMLRDPHSSSIALEQQDLLRRIETSLHLLRPEQREILILRLWDERSYQEIANILQKSEAACKMSVSRALAALREQAPLAFLVLTLSFPAYALHSS